MQIRLVILLFSISATSIAQTGSSDVLTTTTSTLNRDIVVNDMEHSCIIDNSRYETPLDCAFARARLGATGSGATPPVPQTVRAGSGVYYTNTGLQVTSTNGIPINFHGAAKSAFDGGTTIRLMNPLVAGTTVISFPYLPGPGTWNNITWTDVTIDANGYADMCWDFEAPADAYFARLNCRNAVGGRSHWRFGGYSNQITDPVAGTVPQGNNGTGFQTTIDDIFDIKDGAAGPGANITVTLGGDGSLNDANVAIQPDAYNSYASVDGVLTRPVIIKSATPGMHPCTNTPVAVATVAAPPNPYTRSALQTIHFTTPGTGCTGTVIVAAPDLALAQFSGEIALTDSQVSNVVCNSSGMTCVNGQGLLASSFGDFHPTNTGYGILEYGRVTFTGRQECDSLYLDCIWRRGSDPVIPTSISNAYAYVAGSNPSSQAYTGNRLYNFTDYRYLTVDGRVCLYPDVYNNCQNFALVGTSVLNLPGGDLTINSTQGQQTYIGGNNMIQAIFNGNGIYPNQTQDFGGSGALWNNGYFNNLHYNNIITPELTRDVGKTCKIAGYIRLKINGKRRKLALCE